MKVVVLRWFVRYKSNWWRASTSIAQTDLYRPRNSFKLNTKDIALLRSDGNF
jgi:hypothetical protein